MPYTIGFLNNRYQREIEEVKKSNDEMEDWLSRMGGGKIEFVPAQVMSKASWIKHYIKHGESPAWL